MTLTQVLVTFSADFVLDNNFTPFMGICRIKVLIKNIIGGQTNEELKKKKKTFLEVCNIY